MSSSLLLRCSTRWRQCKKKKAKIESPMRLSGLKESFMVKKSEDPYEDFKRSMIKMILEKQMFEISICIVLENLEYPENFLIRVREMAMVSAIQEAQKDNLRSFNDYMMTVLENHKNPSKRLQKL
ncbi:Nuclear pore complex protein NUP93A [Camellia lanceoleosa]|uniref:Nuclear pore complex protein NUP93A n=1 Tax=Camellia lanceoleosa TaxID=1840588 RepID=A0ACC0FUJ8_9ERIC|nr:Nuclear pore complex protein NUP93A [Camellia lanceoleosa]